MQLLRSLYPSPVQAQSLCVNSLNTSHNCMSSLLYWLVVRSTGTLLLKQDIGWTSFEPDLRECLWLEKAPPPLSIPICKQVCHYTSTFSSCCTVSMSEQVKIIYSAFSQGQCLGQCSSLEMRTLNEANLVWWWSMLFVAWMWTMLILTAFFSPSNVSSVVLWWKGST